jgi:hypothetical protein
MHLKYKVEITNDDTGEIIYIREFSSQVFLEEHLREMEREVEIYNVVQQEEATKHIEYPEHEEEDAGHIEDRF